MRRSLLVVAALATVGALAGCIGHAAAVRPSTHVPGRTDGGPSTTSGLLVAAVRPGALAFLHVGPDRHARPVAEFAPPRPGETVSSVSLTSGAAPLACATWVRLTNDDGSQSPSDASLVCYRPGASGTPVTVAGVVGRPMTVALSADGRQIAWIDSLTADYETNVVFGRLTDGRVADLQRVRRGGTAQECSPCLDGVTDVAWAGNDALLVSRNGQDDEGGGLGRLPLDPVHIGRGWQYGPRTFAAWRQDQPYEYFDKVIAADARTAYAIERPSYNGPPPKGVRARAVTVDLVTGRRLAVLATALPGRDVAAVSGGARGIVYETDGDDRGSTCASRATQLVG